MTDLEFDYVARNSTGEIRRGRIGAVSEVRALELIKGQGMVPVSLSRVARLSLAGRSTKFRKAGIKDLAQFCRQFSIMLDAGMPIVTSLDIICKNLKKGPFKNTLEAVLENVEKGMSLSDAFARCQGAFDRTFISMLDSGERAGDLDQVMDRFADLLERRAHLKAEVKGAMIYPAVLGVMGIAVVVFMLVGVLPKFTKILMQSGGELPPTTLVLMTASRIISEYYPWMLGFLAVTAAGFSWTLRQPKGRMMFDTFILKAPIFGKLVFKSAFTRISQTVAILLKSGVPILDVLGLSAEVAGNKKLVGRVLDMRDRVSRGEGLARQFAAVRDLPPMVVQMITIGEETGSMDQMFAKIADYYEKEVEVAIKSLTKLIEPLMLLIMGGFIALITVSLIQAIMSTITTLQ